MTGHNYPDHFYADALAKDQKPTGAYRAPAEMPKAERKLRTALAYVNHARDLIRDALGDNEPAARREARVTYDVACEKIPAQSIQARREYRVYREEGVSEETAKLLIGAAAGAVVTMPLDELNAAMRAKLRLARVSGHPMHAETIRDHDERLAGREDRL